MKKKVYIFLFENGEKEVALCYYDYEEEEEEEKEVPLMEYGGFEYGVEAVCLCLFFKLGML